MLSHQAWALRVKQALSGALFTALQGELPVQDGGVVSHGIVKNGSMAFDGIALQHNSSGRALDTVLWDTEIPVLSTWQHSCAVLTPATN